MVGLYSEYQCGRQVAHGRGTPLSACGASFRPLPPFPSSQLAQEHVSGGPLPLHSAGGGQAPGHVPLPPLPREQKKRDRRNRPRFSKYVYGELLPAVAGAAFTHVLVTANFLKGRTGFFKTLVCSPLEVPGSSGPVADGCGKDSAGVVGPMNS